jgi:hypothetical protein
MTDLDKDLAAETFGPLEDYEPESFGEWPKVVALSGAAGSGKSTASAWLATKGYELVKFAGPLKSMCRAVGLTDEHIEGGLKQTPCELLQGKTPRQFMQWLGTEFGRDMIGPAFWTDLWKARALAILEAGGRVVVDDCRFENEADVVRSIGGVIVRLTGRGGIAGGHVSEEQTWLADHLVENTGTVEDLRRLIADALRY